MQVFDDSLRDINRRAYRSMDLKSANKNQSNPMNHLASKSNVPAKSKIAMDLMASASKNSAGVKTK